jgi:hypothetical protein
MKIYFWHFLLLKFLGTTKPAYAPEPHDVGRYTQAEVKSGGQTSITKIVGSVDPVMVSWWMDCPTHTAIVVVNDIIIVMLLWIYNCGAFAFMWWIYDCGIMINCVCLYDLCIKICDLWCLIKCILLLLITTIKGRLSVGC